MPKPLETDRLLLLPASAELLRHELTGPAAVGVALQVTMPSDWPPGEFDRDAVEYFLSRYAALGADADGWFAWYIIDRASQTLVGSAGYFGPPDEQGQVEIGYSISQHWRRRGIATEAVAALTEHALGNGAWRVIAHTAPENAASRGALDKNGFRPSTSAREGMLCFALEGVTD